MQALIMSDNGTNYHSTGFLLGMYAACEIAGMSLQKVWQGPTRWDPCTFEVHRAMGHHRIA